MLLLWCVFKMLRIYSSMAVNMIKPSSKATPEIQIQMINIAMMLKEIRLSEGMTQNGLISEGISRRMIQRAEYGSNITLISLLAILECYGYTLKDLDLD